MTGQQKMCLGAQFTTQKTRYSSLHDSLRNTIFVSLCPVCTCHCWVRFWCSDKKCNISSINKRSSAAYDFNNLLRHNKLSCKTHRVSTYRISSTLFAIGGKLWITLPYAPIYNESAVNTLIISRVLFLYCCATDGKFCQITTNDWLRISTISVVVDVKLQYIDILSWKL